ncbi:MAG: flavodoxin family protein [Ruminococcaceae bacterium]|nr:flavodoxin family protein [Oscillospiraceae bacterium]
MAFVVVWSSPNTDGLTAASKDRIISGIRAARKDVVEFHLNRKKIEMCSACGNGWGTCISKGSCVKKDDFQEIYDAFREAEGIVLVTPVYWGDLSENLKALLDRMRRCEPFTNHWLNGKRCLLVACAGGSGNGTISCLDRMETTMRHMGVQALDRLPITRFSREYMLPAMREAGEQFALHAEDWK